MGATVRVAKRAKVWNRAKEDYKEIVMGNEVFIPKGGYIETSRHEAMKIRGHCTGLNKKLPLEVELIYDDVNERERFIDHRTGQEFPTLAAWAEHMGIDPKTLDSAKTSTVYPCPVCDKKFYDADKAKTHIADCLAGIGGAQDAPSKPRKTKE